MKEQLKIALRKASNQGLIVLLPILGSFLFLASASADFNGNLTINVAGIKNQSGKICASLFSGSQGFPSDSEKAVQSECIKITENPQKLSFKNLKPGNYAVALIHDANEDGMMNTNSFGIPVEGFGFSNNPAILTGPPKFNQAAVLVAGSNTDLQIKMQYLLGR
ncbi:DUF2141 domain-containing protein [Dolichospermum planctonicum CS-1226]|uniref:DUF2141 domain-containing protein n=1 Tax=Dolichospermum planctonicum CS-1226 TaxID=3021751 RepID=A0ABT5AHU6_9CYAN|nr:DUF2141 domain-containing protein [Dolichospermum planctonicum]MDB9535985.1 DUF2141 domain-containing protein [Dolichospermum planctonicum CS-1226]